VRALDLIFEDTDGQATWLLYYGSPDDAYSLNLWYVPRAANKTKGG